MRGGCSVLRNLERRRSSKTDVKPVHAIAILALAALQSDVHALNPPSDSDGPVKLLGCVVQPGGLLEAEVSSQSDDAMSCYLRCYYELGSERFSHTFEVTIPARYTGRLGRFDTNGAKPGRYSGDVGNCTKTSMRR